MTRLEVFTCIPQDPGKPKRDFEDTLEDSFVAREL